MDPKWAACDLAKPYLNLECKVLRCHIGYYKKCLDSNNKTNYREALGTLRDKFVKPN